MGRFIRVAAKTAPAADAQKAEEPQSEAQQADTLTRMADLSKQLREMAATISHASVVLDDLAIEVEQRIDGAGKEGEKLRQLRQLLVSI